MEKTIVSRLSANQINFELIQKTINNIEIFVNDHGYQFKDRKVLDEITEEKFKVAFNDLSMKKRKKLASFVWSVNNKPTMSRANKFLHFLMTKILKSDLRVRITYSPKEIAIQEKRKAYKELLAKTKATYADYKTEKGDFYKEQATVLDYLKNERSK